MLFLVLYRYIDIGHRFVMTFTITFYLLYYIQCANTFLEMQVLICFQAMNPSINAKEGQSVTLACAVHVKGVGMKNIIWYKDGDRIYDSYKLSVNRFIS